MPETDAPPKVKPRLSPPTAPWDSEMGHLIYGETEAQTEAQDHSQFGAQASCSQMRL